MSKYIQDYIKNNTKTVFWGMSKPQKRTMNLLVRRIFKSQSGILRKLGDGNQKVLPKTVAQRFSRELGKVELLSSVEKYADRKIIQNLEYGDVIAYDLTNFGKTYSAYKI